MKTLSIVTPPVSVISANFIVEHKDFPLSIIPSVYNPHFFKICIVPKGWDYRQIDKTRGDLSHEPLFCRSAGAQRGPVCFPLATTAPCLGCDLLRACSVCGLSVLHFLFR